MILESIELENIRSYRSASVEFPRGISLFVGDVGSGKSTVLMGIEFALFGLSTARNDGLLSKGAREGSVTLRFEAGGTRYEVRRALRRGSRAISHDSKSSYLKEGGETSYLGAADLKQRIMQVLRLNEPDDPKSVSRIFRYAVFTPQEEMKAVLQDRDRRKETIRKAFGVEDYSTAHENSGALAASIGTSMAELGAGFRDLERRRAELREAEGLERAARESISGLEGERDARKRDRDAKRAAEAAATARLREKAGIESRRERAAGDRRAAEARIGKCDEVIRRGRAEMASIGAELAAPRPARPTAMTAAQVQDGIERFGRIGNEIAAAEAAIASARRRHADLDARTAGHTGGEEGIKRRRGALESSLGEGRARAAELEEERSRLRSQVLACEAEVAELEKGIERVEGLGEKCAYCGHALTREHLEGQKAERERRLGEASGRLEGLRGGHRSAEAAAAEAGAAVREAERGLAELERVAVDVKDRAENAATLERLGGDLEGLLARNAIPEEAAFPSGGKFDGPVPYLSALKEALLRHEEAERRAAEAAARRERAGRDVDGALEEKRSLEAEAGRLQKEEDGAAAELEAYAGVDAEIERRGAEAAAAEAALTGAEVRLADAKKDLARHGADARRLAGEVGRAEAARARHGTLGSYRDWVQKFFAPAVLEIEKQVMLSIQGGFDETYQRWYSFLIDDPTKSSRIDEEFTPIVEQDGYEQDVGNMSGGEKTSIALAYRLTLNSMIRRETDALGSNLLILDEPTDGFSRAQMSRVRSLLQELRSEQIILVSHERELEGYVDSVFDVSKEAGVSRVARRG